MSNTIVIAGNVGKDPEQRVTQNDKKITNFSIASKTGKDKTSWFNVTCFGKTGDFVTEHVKKGTLLYVTGTVEISKGKDDKYYTNVIAERVGFLGAKKQESGEEKPAKDVNEDISDEVPF